MSGPGTAAWAPEGPKEASTSLGGPQRQPLLDGHGRDRAGLTKDGLGPRTTRRFRFGSEDRPDPDPPLSPGARVGERYRVIRLLGEGGMGRVYEAEHTVLRRHVALKLLRREAQEQAEHLARFEQEALAASCIGTPQIVEVVDFASHVGAGGLQTYMVMELLVGESLEDWMARGADLNLELGLELLAQLCEGLGAAHRAGVIHRDIKPANVFCCAPDPTHAGAAGARVKILDFGIAKITAGARGVQTRQGSLLGTPYYLAPERVMGTQLTPAADVYSVGVILYEMLTGVVPFVAESFMGILARHVHTEALDPRQAAPGRSIPDEVASTCMGLLAKDPAARPSAEELARSLRSLLDRHGPALRGVAIGPREAAAGPGEDTQVLAEGEVGQAISERPTAPPSMEGFALSAGSSMADSGSRARSSTAIGHSSAAGSARTSVVGGPRLEPAPKREQAGRGLAVAIGLVIALGLTGVGSWWLFRVGLGSTSNDTAEPTVEAPTVISAEGAGEEGEASAAAVTPLISTEDLPPAPPPPEQASADPPAPSTIEAPGEPEPSPHSRDNRDSSVKHGGKPQPKPEGPKPDHEPDPPPADPDPVPTDPPPSTPDPPPSDTKPDPELPTIKDDVYD